MARWFVAVDEGIDVLPDLLWRGEACVLESAAAEDGEPDLDLVHPRRMRRSEMDVHVGMKCQPEVAFGLVRIEIVEHHVDGTTIVAGCAAAEVFEAVAAARDAGIVRGDEFSRSV